MEVSCRVLLEALTTRDASSTDDARDAKRGFTARSDVRQMIPRTRPEPFNPMDVDASKVHHDASPLNVLTMQSFYVRCWTDKPLQR